MDWLFEQYNNDDLIVIDSDNADDNDIQMARLIPSHLTNEIDQFRDDLAMIMEMALG